MVFLELFLEDVVCYGEIMDSILKGSMDHRAKEVVFTAFRIQDEAFPILNQDNPMTLSLDLIVRD